MVSRLMIERHGVELHGLKATGYNGSIGRVIGSLDGDRLPVFVYAFRKCVTLKPQNLKECSDALVIDAMFSCLARDELLMTFRSYTSGIYKPLKPLTLESLQL